MGLSLAEARLLLTKAKRSLEQGMSPSRAKAEKKAAESDALTFGKWVERYFEFKGDPKTPMPGGVAGVPPVTEAPYPDGGYQKVPESQRRGDRIRRERTSGCRRVRRPRIALHRSASNAARYSVGEGAAEGVALANTDPSMSIGKGSTTVDARSPATWVMVCR